MTRLLCLGDSITDCGRLFDHPPLGNGYVQMLSQKLSESGRNWEINNLGMDGFTIGRILSLAPAFYLPLRPDIITLLAGINDIGLIMNTVSTPSCQKIMLENSLLRYRELLMILSELQCPVILMEPFLFPWPQEYRNWLPHVTSLSRGIEDLSEEFHFPYVRLHDTLNEAARIKGMETVTTDGIHLTFAGHKILADLLFTEFTQGLGTCG